MQQTNWTQLIVSVVNFQTNASLAFVTVWWCWLVHADSNWARARKDFYNPICIFLLLLLLMSLLMSRHINKVYVCINFCSEFSEGSISAPPPPPPPHFLFGFPPPPPHIFFIFFFCFWRAPFFPPPPPPPKFSVAAVHLHQSYNLNVRYCSRYKPVSCSLTFFCLFVFCCFFSLSLLFWCGLSLREGVGGGSFFTSVSFTRRWTN